MNALHPTRLLAHLACTTATALLLLPAFALAQTPAPRSTGFRP